MHYSTTCTRSMPLLRPKDSTRKLSESVVGAATKGPVFDQAANPIEQMTIMTCAPGAGVT